MTLIALAAAQTLADDVDAWGMPRLRALLPMAGMTVIEQQAESARRAGAARMLLLVDGIPPALAEACDRIRARGFGVDLVRDAADVARLAGGAPRLLLVGDAIVASATAWRAVSSARAPILLVTDDSSTTQALERIDADTRWAGLALIESSSLPALERCPPDWDPQLYLFRSAVQAGVDQLDWDESQFVCGDMAIASSSNAIAALESRVMAQADARERGLGRRWLMGPLVRLAAGPLLARQSSGKVARLLSLGFTLAAGGLALTGFLLPALGCGTAAMLAHVAGDFVARFRPESGLWQRLAQAGIAAQLLVLLLAETGLVWSRSGGWSLDGSFGLAIAVLVAEVTRLRSARPQLDLASVWPLWLGTAALVGATGGAAIIAAAAIALFVAGEWRDRKSSRD